MKKLIPILFLLSVIITGCDNGNDNNEEVVYESVRDTASALTNGDSALVIQNSPLIWRVELEKNSQIEKLKKP